MILEIVYERGTEWEITCDRCEDTITRETRLDCQLTAIRRGWAVDDTTFGEALCPDCLVFRGEQ